MRKNTRKSKSLSVVANLTVRGAAVVVVALVMGLGKILSSSACTQQAKANAALEREYRKLTDKCQREQVLWQKMTTPQQLNQALLRCHLAMSTPQESQVIRMDRTGRPEPLQLATVRAQQVKGNTASYKRKTSKR